MLLQGQKLILQSGAHIFQKQLSAISHHSLVFMFICCTAAIMTTGNNKLKDQQIKYTPHTTIFFLNTKLQTLIYFMSLMNISNNDEF
jgi:hypothetical protein